ncbi:MAG: GTP-binding protein [Micrococcales bacterium]|nr:MAG: GTP-binding protein [Micrococcales bacterium]PIE27368.1 MAG: GTP-binding protein [Micrococcales bacterium]
MTELTEEVGQVLRVLVDRCAGLPVADQLSAVHDRLDQPLRVAIAGRVKAGKSTLLNALVGEQLAPTDAGECTKIVTWYRNGPTYRVTIEASDGSNKQARFSHSGGAIEVDLDGIEPSKIDRLVVDWPSPRLADITLIDTPGIASINTEVSQRTQRFLTPEDNEPTAADAVIYLMRHMHASDLSFLESFHDDEVAQPSPVNAIGLLSRADEVGAGRADAMHAAHRIAARYRSDPKLRRLCQTVLPINGLLAETAATLTQEEFAALQRLAAVDRRQMEELLLSVDRFVADTTADAVPALIRRHLLDRLGVFGVRTALPVIRQERATSAAGLAEVLEDRSGVTALRQELLERFANRRDVLRARSALAATEALLAQLPAGIAGEFGPELERIRSGAHDFAEIRLLNDCRRGIVTFRGEDGVEAERLLGANGTSPAARVGLPATSSPEEIVGRLLAAIQRWRGKGEHPLASRELSHASAVLVRSCEGALAELHWGG